MDAGKAVLLPKGLGFLRDSRPSGCRKTQGEHERAWGHANSNRGLRRVRRPRARILRPEPAGFQQNPRPWRGHLLPRPPACQKVFWTSWAFSPLYKIFRKCGFCDAAGDSRLSRALRKQPKRRGTEPYAGGCANVRSTGAKRRKNSENPI